MKSQGVLGDANLYLNFFIATISSGYALSTVPGFNVHILLPFFSFVTVSIFLLFEKPKTKDKSFFLLTILAFIILSTPLIFVNGDSSDISTHLKFVIIILYCSIFVTCYSFSRFIDVYLKVLSTLVLISLFFYVLVNFFDYLPGLPKVTNVNGMTYYNGYLFFTFPGHLSIRNPGIFWEPGILASFCIFGLIFAYFTNSSLRWVYVLIFGLGVLSTTSAAGYFLLLMILFFYLAQSSFFSRRQFELVCLFVSILSVVSFLIYFYFDFFLKVMPIVFNKFAVQESASIVERFNSPLNNLKIFYDNPVFGVGLNQADNIYSSLTGDSQTSTSTFYLASFGLFGFWFPLMFSLGLFFKSTLNFTSKIIIFVVFFLILNKEPHIYFALTYLIVFYVYKHGFKVKSL